MNRQLLKKLVRIRKKQQDRAALELRAAQHWAEENEKKLDFAREHYIAQSDANGVSGNEMMRRGDDILWHEARATELNESVREAAQSLSIAATLTRRSEILFERATEERNHKINQAEQKLTDEIGSRRKTS